MGEIKLKPCPFCGSSDVKSCPEGERDDGKPWQAYYVHCNVCGTDGPIVQVYDLDTPAEAGRSVSIDRPDNPTCRNLSNDYRSFHCSRCGYKAFTYGDSDCDPEDFVYCPECRAEVVE